MFNRLRYIVLLALVLLSAFQVSAQTDYVCIGATKHYWVNNNPSSTYIWKIGEDIQTSTAYEIFITWDKPAGKYSLTVQERSNNCLGEVQKLEINVASCSFIIPPPVVECVEPLRAARYNTATRELVVDRPDYFTFTAPNTRLDVSGLDTSCQPDCPFTLHWRIDFSSTPDPFPPHNPVTKPSVSGTGQPSEISGSIQFPGDGVGNGDKFSEVVHNITYWIEDSAGNKLNEQHQTITIKPRPFIK